MFLELEKVLPVLEALTKELKVLNENLSDFKEIACDVFGWRVVEDEKEKK